MKKILITSLLSVGALGAYAQGTLNFTDYDYGTIVTHIWSPNSLAPGTQIKGNTASDTPAGSTTYANSVKVGGASGTGLTYTFGNQFTVQLEALGNATTAVPLSSLLPVSQYTASMNTSAANGGAGNWHLGTISQDPGIPGAGGTTPTADFAVACWYNAGGTVTTLAAAQAGGIWGESAEVVNFALTPPSSITGQPQGFNHDETAGSFSLQSVPEPSSIALGVMAAGAFIARRRKS